LTRGLLGEQRVEAGVVAPALSVGHLLLDLAEPVPQPAPAQHAQDVGERRCTRRIV